MCLENSEMAAKLPAIRLKQTLKSSGNGLFLNNNIAALS